MKTSLNGLCAILAHEAIVLRTYDDGVGVLTIGAGHTAMAGDPKPVPGLKISITEAINIFREDLVKYEADVKRSVRVPLEQHQFDALVSWHYNTGSISTATLTKKLNNRDIEGAAKEFKRWNKGGGKVLRGLVKRRKEETAIFSNGDYGNAAIQVFEKKGGRAKTLSKADVAKLFHTIGAVPEEEQNTEELIANPNSALLPKFRPRMSDEDVQATWEAHKELTPDGRWEDPVKVLAIRGYYTDSMGKKGQNDRGIYDDAIFVIEPDGVHNFNGNTDPSRRKRGIANLKAPQAVRYKPGLHGFKRKNGPYPAFRQDARCTVVRDQKGEDTGMFYINLHRGGNTTTSSAGCQTVPPHQWNEFKALLDNLLKKHKQGTLYYTLIDHTDAVEAPKKPSGGNKAVPTAIATGGAAVGGIVASYWDSISTWIGSWF